MVQPPNPNTPPDARCFVEFAQVAAMIHAATEPLQRELVLLKSWLDEWVNTKEALKILGIKHGETLKAMREREGSLIVTKFEGKNAQMPKYLRSSLLAHNESRRSHPRREGRNLADDC